MRQALVLFTVVLLSFTSAFGQSAGWNGVEKVLGRKGVTQGDMLKVTFPRSDLSVRIGEVQVEPGLALTSWIGFRKMGKVAMMMGDMVLLEDEVAPVMARLVTEGVKVTALHNHLLRATPAVMYLHFSGEGPPEKLAAGMHAVLAITRTPLTPPDAVAAPSADWANVEAIFGKKGQKKGNVLQLSFPRKGKITEKGIVVPPFLGVANGINMQMVGDKAATTGDFVLVASEVNPVVKELVDHGINITAIHSHMLFESPRLFFLHFWGYGEPEKLAEGLKAALGRANLARVDDGIR